MSEAMSNKSEVARAAGLPVTAISNYINRKYIPRADTALRIAKALNVPLSWMVDDSQNWPPPKTDGASSAFLQNAGDDELWSELSHRYIRYAKNALQYAEKLKEFDFAKLAYEFKNLPDKKLSDKLRPAVSAVFNAHAGFNTVEAVVDGWKHHLRRMPHEHAAIMPNKIMQAYNDFASNVDIKRFYGIYLKWAGVPDMTSHAIKLPDL